MQGKCNRDCFSCPYPDCICDEMADEDYRELREREANLLFPASLKQKQIAAYQKAYYAEHKERITAYNKAYYAANKERAAEHNKAYYAEHKEQITARKKAYYVDNKERLVAQKKAYNAANKEKIAAYHKAYYFENKERIAARSKAHRAENKERIAAYNKTYYAENKERIRAYQKAYRERKKAEKSGCAGKGGRVVTELKPCPFCGGKGKVSFGDYRYIGHNYMGCKKVVYRVQVICNKCRSRGRPVITDALINPNPHCSKWGNNYYTESKRCQEQTYEFEPYVERAVEAWNRRANERAYDTDAR